MFMVQGMNFIALKQPWLIIMSTALKPFDSGRSVIKFIATIWKGPEWGLGVISCSGAFQYVMHSLFFWQVTHLQTYFFTNSFIPLPSYLYV